MIAVALLTAAFALASAAPAAAQPRRVAVVVGANQGAPGRSPLRYSYLDAASVADALTQVGEFAPADVHVLSDPEPEEVLAALDRELAALRTLPGETLLVFYYSGHADAQALYPRGKPLAFGKLRERLESASATVRIGIIDACSGGGWTGAKGMSPSAPFVVDVPLQLSSEGSVLISSSSGVENAHESEQILGSFFTHHLVAALRGAADSRGDGVVTLTDAFAYAKERTVRDSAAASDPQHPSFSMNLRGRSDLPLSRLAVAETVVELDERKSPLQIIQLSSGVVVLEVPPGKPIRLAVPAGSYLVRRQTRDGTWSREISVQPGSAVEVNEADLELAILPLPTKGGPPRLEHGTLPALRWGLQLYAGILHGESTAATNSGLNDQHFSNSLALLAAIDFGITDRLQLGLLNLAYRAGEPGDREWIFFLGAPQLEFGSSGAGVVLNPQISLRQWLSPSSSLYFSAAVQTGVRTGNLAPVLPYTSIGFARAFDDLIVNLGMSVDQWFALGHAGSGVNPPAFLTLGSVQTEAGRALPLVRYCLNQRWSLDLDFALMFNLQSGALGTVAMGGFSYNY
jgi:Caspase domain